MKDASQKADLRNVFLTWKPYIKFNPFLKRNRINASSFSKFLKATCSIMRSNYQNLMNYTWTFAILWTD